MGLYREANRNELGTVHYYSICNISNDIRSCETLLLEAFRSSMWVYVPEIRMLVVRCNLRLHRRRSPVDWMAFSGTQCMNL